MQEAFCLVLERMDVIQERSLILYHKEIDPPTARGLQGIRVRRY
jgi:hypothetical protein